MDDSEVLNTVSKSVREAVLELFHGDIKAAANWLSRPCRALGNTSPIDSISITGDVEQVLDVIGRLDHGVFQ